jgi:hypothetical protein
MTTFVPPSVAREFHVFTSPARASDRVSAAAIQGLDRAFAFAGANASLARTVTASDGELARLLPAAQGLCAVVGGGEVAFCRPAAQPAIGPAVDLCSPSLPAGEVELAWLLPDGARSVSVMMSDGRNLALAPAHNVYVQRFSLSEALPVRVSWVSAQGTRSFSTRLPPDAGSTDCVHPQDWTAAQVSALEAWQAAKRAGETVGPPPTLP